MQTVHINCLIIRRSTNTNSFGLRGICVIAEHSRRVFEFAANHLDAERYQTGEFVQIPFRVAPDGSTAYPAHELSRQIGDCAIPAKDVPAFLRRVDDTLAVKWTAYRKAKAIEAVTN